MIVCIVLVIIFFILLTFALAKAAGDADDMDEWLWSRRDDDEGET